MLSNPALISFKRIVSEPLAPLVWEVKPLVARGDRVVFYGEFGAMKTWLLFHLAIHLATGRPWLDRFPVPEPRRVLYVDEEMNERTLRRRFKRLAEGLGITPENAPDGLQAFSRIGVRFDAYGAGRLLEALKRLQYAPGVVIVESLARVLDGSENDNANIAQFWQRIEPLLRAGMTFVLSHHMGKPPADGERDVRYRARGAVDILAGSDAGLAVEIIDVNLSSVVGIKSREAKTVPKFFVRLEDLSDHEDAPVVLRWVPRKPPEQTAQTFAPPVP